MIEAFLGIDITKKTFDVALLVQDKQARISKLEQSGKHKMLIFSAVISTPAINFIRVLISLFLSIFFITMPLDKNFILIFLMGLLAIGCVKLLICILRKPINELTDENAGHI